MNEKEISDKILEYDTLYKQNKITKKEYVIFQIDLIEQALKLNLPFSKKIILRNVLNSLKLAKQFLN